ncbi:hypothetical protein GCM10027051_25690 [Niabella terrae]
MKSPAKYILLLLLTIPFRPVLQAQDMLSRVLAAELQREYQQLQEAAPNLYNKTCRKTRKSLAFGM